MKNAPQHVAIIMDGNGRWAEKRGLERMEGHKIGAQVAEKIAKKAKKENIRYVTLYAFSTENWKRPREEVEFLLELVVTYLESRIDEMLSEEVRLRFMGRIEELPAKTREVCRKIESKTRHCTKIDVIVALNYGGRTELVDAFKKIIREGFTDIEEETITDHLYFPDIPEPDLVIRTAGEKRLSNFMLWQCSYSELFFTEVLWPDFSEVHFEEALAEYSRRKRKFGDLKNKE
ncbi:MAG: polyprenyl diphosphate synthase [Kosmotogaceae bacterium]